MISVSTVWCSKVFKKVSISEDAWDNNIKIAENSWNKIRVQKSGEPLMIGKDKSLGTHSYLTFLL